jgi:hypothetical protein
VGDSEGEAMTFTAIFRRGSALQQMWVQQWRLGGDYMGTIFHRTLAGDYVSDELSPEEVDTLSGLDDVILEVMTDPPELLSPREIRAREKAMSEHQSPEPEHAPQPDPQPDVPHEEPEEEKKPGPEARHHRRH